MSKLYLIPLAAIAAIAVVCSAEPQTNASHEALLQARVLKYRFRAGDYDVASKSVTLLEDALRSDPRNVKLLNELGTAYFMQLTALAHAEGGSDSRHVASTAQRAFETYQRATKIEPNDAEATAGRGMSGVILANRPSNPEKLRAAIVDLNRGVELAPSEKQPRLMRAFTSLALPVGVRSDAAVEDDLTFLKTVATGTRAEDVLSLLLADLYLEAGRRQDAQRQYEGITARSSFARDQADKRLVAMQKQQMPTADIARLRANLGRQCTLCHGQ